MLQTMRYTNALYLEVILRHLQMYTNQIPALEDVGSWGWAALHGRGVACSQRGSLTKASRPQDNCATAA